MSPCPFPTTITITPRAPLETILLLSYVDAQVSCRDGSSCKINANWVIWARESDVARPEIPREPKGNITDDPDDDVQYK